MMAEVTSTFEQNPIIQFCIIWPLYLTVDEFWLCLNLNRGFQPEVNRVTEEVAVRAVSGPDNIKD